jgi:hypothetical protein
MRLPRQRAKRLRRALQLELREDARETLSRLKEEYQEHPGPPLSLAIVIWQEELFRRQGRLGVPHQSPGSFRSELGEVTRLPYGAESANPPNVPDSPVGMERLTLNESSLEALGR